MMKKHIARTALLGAFLIAFPAGAATESLPNFRYVRPAERIAAEGVPSWYEIRLDPLLYAVIDNLNSDLRLTGAEQREVPFLVERITGSVEGEKEEQLPGRFTGVQTLPDGRSAVEFELDNASSAVSSLELVTPEKDFRRILSVAAGDGGNWETVLPEYEFRDYPALNLTGRRLVFPRAVGARRVRLIFGAAAGKPEKPLQIDSIRVFQKTTYPMADTPELFPAELIEISRDKEPEHTILIFRADRMPLLRFQLATETEIFQRRVTLSGSDNRRTWTPISGTVLKKIDSDVALTLDIPESRYVFYRLTSRDGAEPPLRGIAVKAFRAGYRVVIPEEYATETLQLYYGGKAPLPEPGWGAAAEPLRKSPPGRYVLQSPRNNPLRPGRNFTAGSWHWIPSLVLLIGTGVLLLLITRHLRRIRETLPSD